MSPSPISTHIPQPLNIILQLPSQIILQNHRTQLLGQVVDLFVFQVADSSGVVNVEARHQCLADFWTDAVEGLERCADEMRFGEVGAEDEDLISSVRDELDVAACTYHDCGGREGATILRWQSRWKVAKVK